MQRPAYLTTQALLEELLDRTGMDVAYMRTVQMDLVSPPAAQVAALLEGVTCTLELAERMRRRLAAWAGRMAPDLIEPTVYEAFMVRLAERALRPLCGDAWAIAAGVDLGSPTFEYPGSLAGRANNSECRRGSGTRLSGQHFPTPRRESNSHF